MSNGLWRWTIAAAFAFSVYVAPAAASGVSYLYDALGRLVQITYENGTTIAFSYDATGNRTSRTITCPGGPC